MILKVRAQLRDNVKPEDFVAARMDIEGAEYEVILGSLELFELARVKIESGIQVLRKMIAEGTVGLIDHLEVCLLQKNGDTSSLITRTQIEFHAQYSPSLHKHKPADEVCRDSVSCDCEIMVFNRCYLGS